jgi:hypothetical protein
VFVAFGVPLPGTAIMAAWPPLLLAELLVAVRLIVPIPVAVTITVPVLALPVLVAIAVPVSFCHGILLY